MNWPSVGKPQTSSACARLSSTITTWISAGATAAKRASGTAEGAAGAPGGGAKAVGAAGAGTAGGVAAASGRRLLHPAAPSSEQSATYIQSRQGIEWVLVRKAGGIIAALYLAARLG